MNNFLILPETASPHIQPRVPPPSMPEPSKESSCENLKPQVPHPCPITPRMECLKRTQIRPAKPMSRAPEGKAKTLIFPSCPETGPARLTPCRILQTSLESTEDSDAAGRQTGPAVTGPFSPPRFLHSGNHSQTPVSPAS